MSRSTRTRSATALSAWRALMGAVRLAGRERSRLVSSILLSTGAMLAAVALLTISGYLISRAAQRPTISTLIIAILAVRAFGITRAALRYAERLVSHDLAFRLLAGLRVRFFQRLAPLVPGDLRGQSRGELLSRFVGDVDALQDLYLRALTPPIVAVLVIVAAGVTGWLILPAAGLVIAGALLMAAIVVPLLTATIAHASGRHEAPARGALASELVEALDGMPELIVCGRVEDRLGRLRAADQRLARLARRDALSAAVAAAVGSLMPGVTVVAVLVVAIPAVHSGALNGVLLAAVAFLGLAAYEGVAPLPDAARRLRACAQAALRLEDVCQREPSIQDPIAPIGLDGRGELVLEHVHARYGTGEPSVLSGVSLRLAPGRRVALVGPSGAGKTTLAELLVRFRDPVAGRVTLDGVDLRDTTQADVRAAVVLASQDAHLFTTTLRENLLLGRRSATEQELFDALARVELDGWARGLPDGLDTQVGQNGDLISGGQRQRIAVARALLADARFLVLDEPTSHLDPDGADRLMNELTAGAGARGLLVITHATAGLDGFDEVLEIDGGRICRRGPSQEVLVGAHTPSEQSASRKVMA